MAKIKYIGKENREHVCISINGKQFRDGSTIPETVNKDQLNKDWEIQTEKSSVKKGD